MTLELSWGLGRVTARECLCGQGVSLVLKHEGVCHWTVDSDLPDKGRAVSRDRQG